MTILRVLFSAVLWLGLMVYTSAWSCVVIALAVLLYPIDPNRRASHRAVTIWGHTTFLFHPLWKIRVFGRENARAMRDGACVVCVNHQSYVDPFALSVLHAHWKWIAKRELFSLPFFGWAMWAVGNVAIVRGDKRSGERMIEGCRAWLARGVSILIFPEGTRSKDGELQPFKHGAFTIALAEGKPILPIVLDGTGAALSKGGFDLSRRSLIAVSVLPAISIEPFRAANDIDGLKDATFDAMKRELARIRASSTSS